MEQQQYTYLVEYNHCTNQVIVHIRAIAGQIPLNKEQVKNGYYEEVKRVGKTLIDRLMAEPKQAMGNRIVVRVIKEEKS